MQTRRCTLRTIQQQQRASDETTVNSEAESTNTPANELRTRSERVVRAPVRYYWTIMGGVSVTLCELEQSIQTILVAIASKHSRLNCGSTKLEQLGQIC